MQLRSCESLIWGDSKDFGQYHLSHLSVRFQLLSLLIASLLTVTIMTVETLGFHDYFLQ